MRCIILKFRKLFGNLITKSAQSIRYVDSELE